MALSSRGAAFKLTVAIVFAVSFVVLHINSSQRSLRKLESFTDAEPFEVSYQQARHDSFGFFDDVLDLHWSEQQRRIRTETIFRYPKAPDTGINDVPIWMINNVDPIFTCPHMRRVGGRGDGGKWTCDPHRLAKKEDCLIYSVGSAGKYEFEDGLVKLLGKHCEIHVFDPNPKYRRVNDTETNNIYYHAWGIKSTYGPTKAFGNFDFRTFPQTMQELNHVDRRIDVFKIDCEGCEWKSYNDWIDPTIDIRQILIETHPGDALKQNVSVANMFVLLMKYGFVPFSKEANTHPAAKPTLTLFEYGFVRLRPSFLNSTF